MAVRSLFFFDAEFAIDVVLGRRAPEAQNHVAGDGTLGDEPEPEREAQDRDRVQLAREDVDDETQEEPDGHRNPHQRGRLGPMGLGLFQRKLLCSHGEPLCV